MCFALCAFNGDDVVDLVPPLALLPRAGDVAWLRVGVDVGNPTESTTGLGTDA